MFLKYVNGPTGRNSPDRMIDSNEESVKIGCVF